MKKSESLLVWVHIDLVALLHHARDRKYYSIRISSALGLLLLLPTYVHFNAVRILEQYCEKQNSESTCRITRLST